MLINALSYEYEQKSLGWITVLCFCDTVKLSNNGLISVQSPYNTYFAVM